MNTEFGTRHFFVGENISYRTRAPNGRYLACSSVRCECCGEPITTEQPLIVAHGELVPESVAAVAFKFIERHPAYECLERISWNGDGCFTLLFSA
jgi:hypothetical protein